MKRTQITAASARMSTASVCRSVTDSLDIDGFEWNYYRAAPGETLSVCYHAHPDEEEIFHVVEGTATFETEQGKISVDAGEVVRFEPGEFQHGFNETDEQLTVLAFSAPREPEIGGIIECPHCGERDHPRAETTADGTNRLFFCTVCGAEVNRKD